jgi:fatty-acyl-CoA synthase
MRGYVGGDEEVPSPLTAGGWLDTGDLGYLAGGSLVVTGRSKDLIIVNGRNIWPQDLEWAAESVEGVRTGDAAAFAVSDPDRGERVVLAVECRLPSPERRAELRRSIQAVLQETSGVEVEVVLVPPRSLALTTSGKLSRAATQAAYLDGSLRDLDSADADVEDAAVLATA